MDSTSKDSDSFSETYEVMLETRSIGSILAEIKDDFLEALEDPEKKKLILIILVVGLIAIIGGISINVWAEE